MHKIAALIFPESFELKTGFDRVRRLLTEKCLCELGSAKATAMHFLSDIDSIELLIGQTEEFRQILISGESFPSQDYYDCTSELHRIRIEGTWIEPADMMLFKLSYSAIGDVCSYLRKREAKYPVLCKSLEFPAFSNHLITAADRIIDDNAQVKDTASERLREIRSSIVSIRNSIDRKTRRILQSLKKDGLVADDAEITIRNGRAVVPVFSSNKRRVRGFIHDESATGQTAFIEPAEVFEMNNDLRDLEFEEKKEIIRILTQFTDMVRPELPEILAAYSFLGEIDFIRAKALVALDLGAVKPKLHGRPRMMWYDAVNPVLKLAHDKQKKEVIPLTFELNEEQRILVISGPNAGGKSVCLKTAGLLQYMLQNGMLVPMKDYSETGIFEQIFIEIGDEQSIENDLSTYSSHLRNLKYFCDNVTASALFLIDEFGSGTEPHLGGAIAESVLLYLSKTGPFGIITTHYGNLKLLAGKIPGIVNGAMLFDTQKMKPVYKLAIGNPGSSYAFEIAGQIGFPDEVLNEAARLTGGTQLDYDRQLRELESEKEDLEKKQAQINMADTMLAGLVERYNTMLATLENSKRNILDKARSDAAELVVQVNRTIENTIREIRENQADRERTKQLREELSQIADELQRANEPMPESNIRVPLPDEKKQRKTRIVRVKKTEPERPLRIAVVGDYVKIAGHQGTGVVEDIRNSKALVIINSMKLWWPLDELVIARKAEYEATLKITARNEHRSVFSGLEEKTANFKTMIDVRGKRAEEVVSIISNWLDDAVLLRVHELRILHGKGNGILRSVIRELLSRTKEVRSFRDEILEQGGHGITVVEIE